MGVVLVVLLFLAGSYGFWRFIDKEDRFEKIVTTGAAMLCFLFPVCLTLWTYVLRYV